MFYLPKQVARFVKEGMELGHAIDKYYGSANSKQGVGGIGYITNGLIDRTAYYLQPAIIALSELKQADEF
jgi:non-canonical (house-cleaning) NTP pyrophosphatase